MELEILAFIASFMGIGGSLPQILKILKTQNTDAISYTTYFMYVASGVLWVSYGLLAPLYSYNFKIQKRSNQTKMLAAFSISCLI